MSVVSELVLHPGNGSLHTKMVLAVLACDPCRISRYSASSQVPEIEDWQDILVTGKKRQKKQGFRKYMIKIRACHKLTTPLFGHFLPVTSMAEDLCGSKRPSEEYPPALLLGTQAKGKHLLSLCLCIC